MSDTPRTDAAIVYADCDDSCLEIYYHTLADRKQYDGDCVRGDVARQIERERNILFAAISEAVARFDKLSWGLDGDCGTGNIMQELEEARDKVCTLNPTGQRTGGAP